MSNTFNEDSRVKIPALIHLTRLGYKYLSFKQIPNNDFDFSTNIYLPSFRNALEKLNPEKGYLPDEIQSVLSNIIKNVVDIDDLGRSFYEKLTHGLEDFKLLDFEKPENNIWECMTEVPCARNKEHPEDESGTFRPDITLYINGLPLVFIEAKKPNNKNGIIAELSRMTNRNQNTRFRPFLNISQIQIFSNNQNYDDDEQDCVTGAFYSTTSYGKPFFSKFREEDDSIFERLMPIDEKVENSILLDTNNVTIKDTAEFQTNLDSKTPTHKVLSSLCSKERLLFFIKYGIAFVEKKATVKDEYGNETKTEVNEIQKHIMRYPQFFASKAIQAKLNKGIKSGIIWHTQGSGKTALAYHNVNILTDYYQKQGIIAKFYFIVDRLDLLEQAAGEFRSRGLTVIEVNSRKTFEEDMQSEVQMNKDGNRAITVVNIQKFSEDSKALKGGYNLNVQRVFFMDEAHRSYNPRGSFLANLFNADRNSVKIALTGTPIIGEVQEWDGEIDVSKKTHITYDSKAIFGDYIHKYYYNASIKDGYTLRLVREGIETTYREKIKTVLDSLNEIEVLKKGDRKAKEAVYAHKAYVEAMVDYIANDFVNSRIRLNDRTIGGMIVCDSSKQAEQVFEELNTEKYKGLTSALILCDQDDKEIRKKERDDFKKGKIDILVVFNMLLTGFDAPRLKKLYVGRIIRSHNLLQSLTRVNRPYKNYHCGYVVDFADIRDEFDKTNKAYFEELKKELGDDYDNYSSIMLTQEEIQEQIEKAVNFLYDFNTFNKEEFRKQIEAISEKPKLLELRKVLSDLKVFQNAIVLNNYEDLKGKIDIANIQVLYSEVDRRIDHINTIERLNNADDSMGLINEAMSQLEFNFKKISEDEIYIADAFQDEFEKIKHAFNGNKDPKDAEFQTLLEKFKKIMGKKNIEESSAVEIKQMQSELEEIRKKVEQKNAFDNGILAHYNFDAKFMRVFKRIQENPPPISSNKMVVENILLSIKEQTDNMVLSKQSILENKKFFACQLKPVINDACTKNNIDASVRQMEFLDELIENEYISEYEMVG